MVWDPSSWRQKSAKQQPIYPDVQKLHAVTDRLRTLPPLVTFREVDHLHSQLAEVSRGRAFLLQGGDCAESFGEFGQDPLLNLFRLLLQMSVTLVHGVGCPVIKVGRIAGQFAKPRSTDLETIGDVVLPSYRGDMVNGHGFTQEERAPDPVRLLDSYFQSAATLNFIKALAIEGYASLRNVSSWNSAFIASSPARERFAHIVKRIEENIQFMEACGMDPESNPQLSQTSFYASHEALLLDYEEGLVRQNPEDGRYYALSGHMVWIGDRTRDLDGAHVEFARGIANPIGLKVGSGLDQETLIRLIDVLDPHNTPGRLVLISRMGHDKIEKLLPPLIEATRDRHVIWSCDPMHGNTWTTDDGVKTRSFHDILAEVKRFFAIHRDLGTHAGGVHLELTGQDVTECMGGVQEITAGDLHHRYETRCDPRLNASQSLELAFTVTDEM